MPRAECDIVEHAAILAQCHLALGAAIQIVEYGSWDPLLSKRAEIFYTDNARRSY
jgi:hypothetical protein